MFLYDPVKAFCQDSRGSVTVCWKALLLAQHDSASVIEVSLPTKYVSVSSHVASNGTVGRAPQKPERSAVRKAGYPPPRSSISAGMQTTI